MAHKFYSQWCSLLQYFMDRAHLSQTGLAKEISSTQSTVQSYLIGRSKPPLEEMDVWATALRLNDTERENFKWVAMETYTPPVIWEKVSALMTIITDNEVHIHQLTIEGAAHRAEIAKLRSERDADRAEIIKLRADIAALTAKANRIDSDFIRSTEEL